MTMKNSSNELQKFSNGFKFIMFPSKCDLCFYKYVNVETLKNIIPILQTNSEKGWMASVYDGTHLGYGYLSPSNAHCD